MDDQRVYTPSDFYQFTINTTLSNSSVRSFKIELGGLHLIEYGSIPSNQENENFIVRHDGAYIYQNITFDTYSSPIIEGILNLTITSEINPSSGEVQSIPVSKEISFDGKGPTTVVTNPPDADGDDPVLVDDYHLQPGEVLRLNLSTTDFYGFERYHIEYNGQSYNTSEHQIDVFYDNKIANKYINWEVMKIIPYDIHGNKGDRISLEIFHLNGSQSSSDSNTIYPVMIGLILLVSIPILAEFLSRKSKAS